MAATGRGKGLLGARGKERKSVDVPAGTIVHMPEDSGLADVDLVEIDGEARCFTLGEGSLARYMV
jgi:hypothetical protein